MTLSRFLIVLSLLMCLAVATASAQKALYLGGGIGNSFVDAELKDAADLPYTIDENTFAWKVFAGYRLAPFLALEGGYRDLGTISTTQGSVALESQTTGWDVNGVGVFTFSIVDLFAKAGAFFWKTDGKVDALESSSKGTGFLWGVGAGVHLGTLGVRLEWESPEVKTPSNLSVVSATVTLGF